MKRTIIILATACLSLALSACTAKEDNTAESSLRIEITPNTVRFDKLYDTNFKVFVTNVSDRNIVFKSYIPSIGYYDGETWIPGASLQAAAIDRSFGIKPQETVELWKGIPLEKITFGDLFHYSSSPAIQEKTTGAPSKPRLYKVGFYSWIYEENWSVEFTVTPPLRQTILRYVLISVSAVVMLGLLLFFFRRFVRRIKKTS